MIYQIRELYSEYICVLQVNDKKTNNSKLEKDLNRQFSKKGCKWPLSTGKDPQYLVVIRETQSKTSMRYYITPTNMDITKKKKRETTARVNKDVEKLRPHTFLGGI